MLWMLLRGKNIPHCGKFSFSFPSWWFCRLIDTEWEVGDAAPHEGRMPLIGSIVLLCASGILGSAGV